MLLPRRAKHPLPQTAGPRYGPLVVVFPVRPSGGQGGSVVSFETASERRLVAAVLTEAWKDLHVASGAAALGASPEQLRELAAHWFQDGIDAPWSFRWCARSLGYDPDGLRARLLTVRPVKRYRRSR